MRDRALAITGMLMRCTAHDICCSTWLTILKQYAILEFIDTV